MDKWTWTWWRLEAHEATRRVAQHVLHRKCSAQPGRCDEDWERARGEPSVLCAPVACVSLLLLLLSVLSVSGGVGVPPCRR
eukprot:scaffold24646_cov129-Isochrysis_galbana.AAC.2